MEMVLQKRQRKVKRFTFSVSCSCWKRKGLRSPCHRSCEFQCGTLCFGDRSQDRSRETFQRTDASSSAKSLECQHSAACSRRMEHKSGFSSRAWRSWRRGLSPQEGPPLCGSQSRANQSSDSSCDVSTSSRTLPRSRTMQRNILFSFGPVRVWINQSFREEASHSTGNREWGPSSDGDRQFAINPGASQ